MLPSSPAFQSTCKGREAFFLLPGDRQSLAMGLLRQIQVQYFPDWWQRQCGVDHPVPFSIGLGEFSITAQIWPSRITLINDFNSGRRLSGGRKDYAKLEKRYLRYVNLPCAFPIRTWNGENFFFIFPRRLPGIRRKPCDRCRTALVCPSRQDHSSSDRSSPLRLPCPGGLGTRRR